MKVVGSGRYGPEWRGVIQSSLTTDYWATSQAGDEGMLQSSDPLHHILFQEVQT